MDRLKPPSAPLIFLLAMAVLWVSARVASTIGWQFFAAMPIPAMPRGHTPTPVTAQPMRAAGIFSVPVAQSGDVTVLAFTAIQTDVELPMSRKPAANTTQPLTIGPSAIASPAVTPMNSAPRATPAPIPSTMVDVGRQRPNRLSLSGWVFIRPVATQPALGQGLLGGSQIGLRAARQIDRHGYLEAYARIVSSGQIGAGAEGAAGIAVRPVPALPVQISVERRERLIGEGRSAMAAIVSGGVSNVGLPAGLSLDGYAAGGIVGLRKRDLFAETAVVVRRRLQISRTVDVDIGVGSWAAAQPGVARLDVGPTVGAAWQTGGLRPRLSIDGRQRAVGNATPQSGVAITLAADF